MKIFSGHALNLRIFFYCLVIFLCSRVIVSLEYYLITSLLHNDNSIIDNLFRFDSEWFERVIIEGYNSSYNPDNSANWPFFPFWPILIRIFSLNAILPIPIVAIVLNQVLLFLAMPMLYLYLLKLNIKTDNIKFAIIILALSPTNIFFCSGLSEPTFLFLSICSFYCLHNDRLKLTILCGALLAVTRMVGICFLIPFVYSQFKKNNFKLNKQILNIIFYAFLMASGLLTYMIYLQIHAGDFLAFLTVQKAYANWSRPGIDWDNDVVAQVINMVYRASIYDLGAFLLSLFGITSILIRHKLIEEAIFNVLCILPGFISGNFWNSFRFDICLVTFYLGVTLASQNSITKKLFFLAFATIISMVCWRYWLGGSALFA